MQPTTSSLLLRIKSGLYHGLPELVVDDVATKKKINYTESGGHHHSGLTCPPNDSLLSSNSLPFLVLRLQQLPQGMTEERLAHLHSCNRCASLETGWRATQFLCMAALWSELVPLSSTAQLVLSWASEGKTEFIHGEGVSLHA